MLGAILVILSLIAGATYVAKIGTGFTLLFIGAGLPDAKPQQGFDFGIVDLVVADNGTGSGTMSPAAKVTDKQGVFVIDEYSGELVRLTNVKKVK